MKTTKNYTLIFSIILFLALNLFAATNKIFPQENTQGTDDDVILDSIDVKENLLDSNTVYQKDFDSLSNHGDWVKINRSELIQDVSGDDANIVEDDDGSVVKVIYIWRPRIVEPDWNPYSNGRWVFTYRGWVWESDYDWGWACYNYGRWYWSSYYGWCWLPGRVWAPNWVIWRNYGNYCCWHPVCPRIHWRHHGHWVRNHTFKSKTKNWVVIDKKDFPKKIDKSTIVKSENNGNILKNSEKIKGVKTFVTDKKNIKYSGPDVTNISKESGVKIEPQKVKITKVVNNGTKSENPTRITRSGPTRDGTRNPTKENGTYNPPRNDGGRTPTRSPESHNNPTKGNGPSKGSHNGSNNGSNNGSKGNSPSKNSGSKGDGSKKK